jgi:class 3 adenylate cyclase
VGPGAAGALSEDGRFALRPLAPANLKGIEAPVPIWRAERLGP